MKRSACVLGVLALGWGSLAARADDLGRLFYTPQQRADLDKQRLTKAEPAPEQVPQEALVTVNGFVTRSSGRTTTWINGVPQNDSIRSKDPARVSLGSAAGSSRVKVGQTLDTTRGEVQDALANGHITVNRKPAPR